MKEKSIFNMVLSIISSVIIIPLMVLGIIFSRDSLTTTFMCFYYPVLMVYYIFKSIYFGKNESTSKTVMYRLSNVFMNLGTTLIVMNFTLYLKNPYNWLLFSYLLVSLILETIIDSLEQGLELKYLLSGMKAFILIFTLLSIYNGIGLLSLAFLAILICYICDLLGKILQNKLLLSFEIISLVIFGIFLIGF